MLSELAWVAGMGQSRVDDVRLDRPSMFQSQKLRNECLESSEDSIWVHRSLSRRTYAR